MENEYIYMYFIVGIWTIQILITSYCCIRLNNKIDKYIY